MNDQRPQPQMASYPTSTRKESELMKYLLMVYFNGAQERIAQLPTNERDNLVQRFTAFFQSPQVRDGNQLQPPRTAATVRIENDAPVTRPGPFPGPSAEPLGGYYLIDADDPDAAAALASRVPALEMGAAVEIRPVVER